MSYQTIDVVKPIVDFIKTCPFLDEFNIDMKQIDTQTFSSDKPPGTALEYVGSVLTGDLNDVLGLRETRRQANFQLWLLRKSTLILTVQKRSIFYLTLNTGLSTVSITTLSLISVTCRIMS